MLPYGSRPWAASPRTLPALLRARVAYFSALVKPFRRLVWRIEIDAQRVAD